MIPTLSVIIPARDKAAFLQRALGSILAAAKNRPGTEIIVVENGSRDGTARLIREVFADQVTLIESSAATAGDARNEGAALAQGEAFCFLDADVLVPADFFQRLTTLLQRVRDGAVGCTVSLPSDGSWIERTWGALHERGISGEVALLNGACLAISRESFSRLGGFSPGLVTGEDADLCLRLIEVGGVVLESQSLRTIHLDNPGTLGEFFRKESWRGLGGLATVRHDRLDRPFAMSLAHGFLWIGAIVVLAATWFDLRWAAVSLAMTQAVPLLAVAYRVSLAQHPPSWMASLALYQVYFLARFWALVRIVAARLRTGKP